MTLQDALDRFLVQLAADGRSHHTIAQYRRHVGLVARWVANVGPPEAGIEALDHEDLARFLAAPVARACAHGGEKQAATLNTLRSSLRTFFAYVHRAGYIARDPARLVRRAICGSRPPRALTGDERERLLATLAADQTSEAARDHALFHLMLATGIRLSAAVGLDVEDLDLPARELTIHTKGDRTERVFLGKAITEHLRGYVADRRSGPLFTAGGGRRVSGRHVHRRFGEWLKKAGIRRSLSPHSMRHHFATALYERTGNVLLVKAALHHRSIASTLVYAHVRQEQLRHALRRQ
jgi:site-specific recombinase XerC